MKMEIIEKIKNPFLERTEIVGELSYEKETPSRDAVKKAVAEQLKANEKLIVVRHIYPVFGFKKAKVIANLYEKEMPKGIEGVFLNRNEKGKEKESEKQSEEKKAR